MPDVLVRLVGDAPWFLKASVRVHEGALVLAVLVTRRTDEARCCVPRVCNDVPVEVKEADISKREAP